MAYTWYLPIFFLFNLHLEIPNDHPVSALESSATALTDQIFRDWSVHQSGQSLTATKFTSSDCSTTGSYASVEKSTKRTGF